MKEKLLNYWWASFSAAVDAMVHAIVAFCGMAGIAQISPEQIHALDWKQGLAVAGISFGLAQLNYIANHPLSNVFPKLIAEPPAPIPAQFASTEQSVATAEPPTQ